MVVLSWSELRTHRKPSTQWQQENCGFPICKKQIRIFQTDASALLANWRGVKLWLCVGDECQGCGQHILFAWITMISIIWVRSGCLSSAETVVRPKVPVEPDWQWQRGWLHQCWRHLRRCSAILRWRSLTGHWNRQRWLLLSWDESIGEGEDLNEIEVVQEETEITT